MTASRVTVVAVVALVAQSAILGDLRIDGVAADAPMLIAVLVGVLSGPRRGALTGFGVGVGFDLVLVTPFGLSALAYSITGYMSGWLAGAVGADTPFRVAGTAALASGVGVFVYAAVGATVGLEHLVSTRIVAVAGLVGLANGALAVPTRGLVRWALAPVMQPATDTRVIR